MQRPRNGKIAPRSALPQVANRVPGLRAGPASRGSEDSEPGNARFLHTLGVVQYRNGPYREAVATLAMSLATGRGESDGFDLFLLAMCHARLDDKPKARDCFNRAVRWCAGKKDLPAVRAVELKAFRAEAEALLQGGPS